MKENKGITLIALVITIIVLLILAGVAIAMLSGDNGILNKASQSAEANDIGEVKDEIGLKVNEAVADYLDKLYNGEEKPVEASAAVVIDKVLQSFKTTSPKEGITIEYTKPTSDVAPGSVTIKSKKYQVTGTVKLSGAVDWGEIEPQS